LGGVEGPPGGALVGVLAGGIVNTLRDQSQVDETAQLVGEVMAAVLAAFLSLVPSKAYDSVLSRIGVAIVGLASWSVVRLLAWKVWNWPIEDEPVFSCSLAGAMAMTPGLTRFFTVEAGLVEVRTSIQSRWFYELFDTLGQTVDALFSAFIGGAFRA